MAVQEKAVRKSVNLPAKMATQIRSMAKRRRLSANRMLVELVEEGIEVQKQKKKHFSTLRSAFVQRTIRKKSSASARNLADWSLVGNAEDRTLGKVSGST